MLHDGKQLVRGTAISFAESSADLTAQAKGQLEKTALALAGLPNKIEIRGHSTRRPLPQGSPSPRRLATNLRPLSRHDGVPRATRHRARTRSPEPGRPLRAANDPQSSQTGRSSTHASRSFLLDEIVEDLTGTSEERNERFQGPPGEEPTPKKETKKAPENPRRKGLGKARSPLTSPGTEARDRFAGPWKPRSLFVSARCFSRRSPCRLWTPHAPPCKIRGKCAILGAGDLIRMRESGT